MSAQLHSARTVIGWISIVLLLLGVCLLLATAHRASGLLCVVAGNLLVLVERSQKRANDLPQIKV